MVKSNILLLFPDGVGIRNYLYSETFKGEKDCILFHNFDKETAKYLKDNSNLSKDMIIPDYKESLKEKFLRELISLSRLQSNSKLTGNNTILLNWKKKHIGLKKKLFYALVEIISLFVKKYSSILKLEEVYQKEIRKTQFYKEIEEILLKIKPKGIFCSHQRAIKAATIFTAAKDLNIITYTVIYSWDNLPKARLALKADKYLVWSAYMKKELIFYYPEITNDTIEITGSPQFEFYFDKNNIIDKNEFYNSNSLDINKKIICFSGDDIMTSPNDPDYLRDLVEELIKSGLDKDYQILLRRCPVDLSGRFQSVVKEYPNLIKELPPAWHFQSSQKWHTIFPLKEDISLLVSIAFYSNIVINVGSTMAFDFSMYNKPCIFINYNHKLKAKSTLKIEEVYKFQHFKSMPHNNSVLWLNSKSEIIDLLKNNNYNNLKMNSWKKIVLGEYVMASSNIKNVLNL